MDDEALLATVGRGAEAEELRTETKAFRGHRMAPTLPAILVIGVLPTTITITGTFFYPNPEARYFSHGKLCGKVEILRFALGSLVQRLFNAPRSSK